MPSQVKTSSHATALDGLLPNAFYVRNRVANLHNPNPSLNPRCVSHLYSSKGW